MMTGDKPAGRKHFWPETPALWRFWPFGLLLAALFLVTYPAILSGAQTFFYRDYGVLGFPFIHHHRASFWQGELPLWNPYSNCGAPFLAQWGTMVLYPPGLIYLLLPLPWSLSFFCLFHLWLGGMGMFVLARRCLGNGWGPVVAGVVFAFGGVSQSCLMWPNYTVAIGWMPWVIVLVQRGCRNGGRSVVAATIIGALQMLAGVPEIVLMTWAVAMLVVMGPLLADKELRNREGSRRLMRSLAVVGLVACLCAAQLLPFFDLLANSQRQGSAAPVKWAMPIWGWANLVLPAFHYVETYQGSHVQSGQGFFSSYYPGLPTLLLAGLALGKVRRRLVWLLAGLTLISLVLALGDGFPPNAWLREIIPLSGLARYPVKFVLLAAFTIPILAGFGVQSLLSPPRTSNPTTKPSGRRVFVIVAVGLALLGAMILLAVVFRQRMDAWQFILNSALWRGVFVVLAGLCLRQILLARDSQRHLVFSVALLMVLWIDLQTHLPGLNPTLTNDYLTPGVGAERAGFNARPVIGAGRIFITAPAEELLLHSVVPSHGMDFLGKRLAMWSNLNVLDDIPKVNGSSTLRVGYEDQLQSWIYDAGTNAPEALLDFLGATYQSAPENPIEWVQRPGVHQWVTVGQAAKFMNESEARINLLRTSFAPSREVWLPAEARNVVRATNQVPATVSVRSFTETRLQASVTAPQTTMLVVAQSWYPNWRASLDGKPVLLWRANHAFQAVEIPEGTHTIEIAYQDNRFRLGCWIALVALAVCLMGLRSSPEAMT